MPLHAVPSSQHNVQRKASQPKPATTQANQRAHPQSANNILQLQSLQGNRAVQRMLAEHSIQPKLTVGAAHDAYEAEADAMAAQVVNGPAMNPQAVSAQAQPTAQRLPLANQLTPVVQRDIEDEPEEPAPAPSGPEEDERIQTKRDAGGSFETGAGFESQLANAQGGGQALPTTLRREFEPKFGADFSNVQVHTDSQSAQLNQQVGARAFTHRNHIYLNSGQYNPQTAGGKQLLAHELTHTIQQGAAKGNNKLQKKPMGIQRMTVKFLPHIHDTYVNPMTQVKLQEQGATPNSEEGVYQHKGYTLKPGQTAPTVRAAARRVRLNENLTIVAHGNERQMQAGMNAADMASFIKGLLPDAPLDKKNHTGIIDLTGCLTAWKPFWAVFRKPLAGQVADILKAEYPKLKVQGYEGIMHVGTSEFGIAPVEITPWAYKVGKWATYKKLYNAYMKETNKTKEKVKKDKARAQYKSMEQSGSIRRPTPKVFG